jgi:hypothetical protein
MVDYLLLVVAFLFLLLSLLSVYRPGLVWGKLPPELSAEKRIRLLRRRKMGSVVFFAVGAVLLVLSLR